MSTALVVVDVQNDFCEGGALGVEGGHATAAAIRAHLSDDVSYATVVATRDHHIDPGDHFSDHPDFVDSWPPHCVANTPGAELKAAIADYPFDAIFDKGEYSAAYSGFEGRDHQRGVSLADYLQAAGITEVVVCGIATDYCVNATAVDAATAGFATRVMLNLTAAVDPSSITGVCEGWTKLGITVD